MPFFVVGIFHTGIAVALGQHEIALGVFVERLDEVAVFVIFHFIHRQAIGHIEGWLAVNGEIDGLHPVVVVVVGEFLL